MSSEIRFTTEWWKQLFKNGKPLGYGGVELRNEDKYLWVLQLQRWFSSLAQAVIEKYGKEGEKLVEEVYVDEATLIFKFLIEALDTKPKDIADVIGILSSFDANAGNEVEIRNVSPDRSSAEFYCKRCTMFEAGLTTKAVCANISMLMGKALMKALGPLANSIEMAEVDIDPPKHCKIVLRKKQ